MGIGPLVPGEHLLVASPDSLPFVVEELIGDEERLDRLRAQAYERLSAWIPFGLSVSVLRAAVVELVGVPVPTGASLGTAPPPAALGQQRVHACRGDRGGGQVDAPGAERCRRELFEVRRQLGVLQEAVRSAGHDSPIELIHESPSWRAQREPRLTILTVLGGDADPALSTLDSLARSRSARLGAPGRRTPDRVTGRSGPSGDGCVTHPRIPARLQVRGCEPRSRGGSEYRPGFRPRGLSR